MRSSKRDLTFHIGYDIVTGKVIMRWEGLDRHIGGWNPPSVGWKEHCAMARYLKKIITTHQSKNNIEVEVIVTRPALTNFQHNFNPALEGGLTTMEVRMKEEAVQTGVAAISEQLGVVYDAGFADGKASVEIPVDTTPYDDAYVQEQVSIATEGFRAKIAELETQLSQKDADALEEAIANELAALAQKLRDRTPSKPVDVAPIEETKGTDAQP